MREIADGGTEMVIAEKEVSSMSQEEWQRIFDRLEERRAACSLQEV
jgi:hypothetical protein